MHERLREYSSGMLRLLFQLPSFSAQVTTLFEMFDPTSRGEISRDQYFQALLCIGVETPTVPLVRNEQTRSFDLYSLIGQKQSVKDETTSLQTHHPMILCSCFLSRSIDGKGKETERGRTLDTGIDAKQASLPSKCVPI